MADLNPWLVAAGVLALGLVPCGILCLRGDTMDRLVAVELAGVLAALLTVLLAEGFHRPAIYDLVLALVLVARGGPGRGCFGYLLSGE